MRCASGDVSRRLEYELSSGVFQVPSASSNGGSDTETDSEGPFDRGRAYDHSPVRTSHNGAPAKRSFLESSPHPLRRASSDEGRAPRRGSFTRSRSPVVRIGNGTRPSRPQRTPSSSIIARHKATRVRYILPATLDLPVLSWRAKSKVSVDARSSAESTLLLCSLLYAAWQISQFERGAADAWLVTELLGLFAITVVYLIWTRCIITSTLVYPPPPPQPPARPQSPRVPDFRESRRGNSLPIQLPVVRQEFFGFIWMSVPKNYRASSDDGILSALLIGPLLASGILCNTLRLRARHGPSYNPVPPAWRIEPPAVLASSTGAHSYTALEALVASGRNLVDLSTLLAAILLTHVCASWWAEEWYRRRTALAEGERGTVPRKETKKAGLYIAFALAVSIGMLVLQAVMPLAGLGLWQNLSYVDVLFSSVFFQATLYVAIRLAHQGFTLGELGLFATGATILFMELTNLTIAKIWPGTTLFIKTYRAPTPLLIYQLALLPGSLLTGFLLSPILVLSRRLARQPAKRLRQGAPAHLKQRRLVALAFYAGAVLIIGGVIGIWTQWCMGGRNPWTWAVFWVLKGRRKWSRPALLTYWGLLGIISVAGWTRQLARSRRYRPMSTNQGQAPGPGEATSSLTGSMFTEREDVAKASSPDTSVPSTPPTGGSLSLTLPNLSNLPNLPNLPNGTGMSQAATELLDAADKRVPTLSLNARRKFFHALAVAMFLPGLAIDPAFTHLSFSAAFALFTFAEYVRYFALYPLGAAVHVFLNEFLDDKDAGTAILSHFYLLTGCAGSLWFEPSSQLLQYTGVLALGVGDAVASIVGKRIGRIRWSPTTPKTLEGSTAFVLSVVSSAWLLRVAGVAEAFSTWRYSGVAVLASLLEALSVQNDNLTLPLYMWTMSKHAPRSVWITGLTKSMGVGKEASSDAFDNLDRVRDLEL
ncbi:hypothetical protein PUNSTDRAFT_139242 [Punctularia strigosozonata HHB-11173 SS5]|uniref:dolichol kinase n=1 Tax=Punctularia strigosozonata (strain HHB-11173) TaxID=741275 RepID=R7S1Q5_PUNST|nr:uncharacterized protein PUNSTDRAFT_139242 [Punctularia strigosozonata HHB-11173 SS5]EIN03707.1 hypothetical protein PUNSTDRAFT_139242 [Punctularia strigosozonata HHB-11173 SS5]